MVDFDNGDTSLGSLRNKVFSQIQNDILNGHYEPGESLIEKKLSDELGVSRTPIREALRQLELEGLVSSIPNKGVIVKGVSTQDIRDIYSIRMLIEGLAVRWATEKITEREIAELKEAVELEEFYTAKNDNSHLLKFDTRFHDIIYKACKSRMLMHTLSTFHHYVQKAREVSMSSPERAREVLVEHKAILQAIYDRNADKAEQLTIEHIKNASSSLIKQMRD